MASQQEQEQQQQQSVGSGSATMPSFDIADLPEIFADVTPTPQADGPTAVCRIDYPPRFVQAYDYFRAILRLAEYSARALRLTELCLEQNPANYTVWHYRRLCLYEQIKDKKDASLETWISNDLGLAARLGGDNPKNYQIWYHRRAIFQALLVDSSESARQDLLTQTLGPTEMEYVATVLQVDGKNYHAWSHRQWLLKTLAACDKEDDGTLSWWETELTYTASLIQQDLRNNSAWNQRWFVTHQGNKETLLTLEQAVAELDFAWSQAALDPHNESPFSYFLAAAKELRQQKNDQWQNELLPSYIQKLSAMTPESEGDDVSPYILSTMVELLSWQGDNDKARALLDRLAESVDPIRRKYWAWRKTQLPVSVP